MTAHEMLPGRTFDRVFAWFDERFTHGINLGGKVRMGGAAGVAMNGYAVRLLGAARCGTHPMRSKWRT